MEEKCLVDSSRRREFVYSKYERLNDSDEAVAVSAKNGRLRFFLFVREFSNERTRVERRAAYQKTKRKRLFTTAFSAYLKWITQAGFETIDLSLSSSR